jgi:hypothetical protein
MARPLKKLPTSQIIATVTRIRSRNNRLWMDLLTLAIKAKPRKAKSIIRKIVQNDKDVSKWMGRV